MGKEIGYILHYLGIELYKGNNNHKDFKIVCSLSSAFDTLKREKDKLKLVNYSSLLMILTQLRCELLLDLQNSHGDSSLRSHFKRPCYREYS